MGKKKSKKEEKWLQEAAERMEEKGTEGAFTAWCKRHGFKGVTQEAINLAKKIAKERGDTTLLRRAIFAENARKIAKKR